MQHEGNRSIGALQCAIVRPLQNKTLGETNTLLQRLFKYLDPTESLHAVYIPFLESFLHCSVVSKTFYCSYS